MENNACYDWTSSKKSYRPWTAENVEPEAHRLFFSNELLIYITGRWKIFPLMPSNSLIINDGIFQNLSKNRMVFNYDQRLADLMHEYETPLLSNVIGDKTAFIQRIKWNRNYYTHYDSSNEKKALTNSELFFESEKLKVLLKVCLLKEIGLDDDKISEAMKRDDSVRWIASHGKKPKSNHPFQPTKTAN